MNTRLLILCLGTIALLWAFVDTAQAADTPSDDIRAERFVQSFQFADYYATPVVMPLLDMRDAQDNPVHLGYLAGRWVVLNLWATWCPPCLAELPSLKNLADRGDDPWDVVIVSMDRGITGDRMRRFLGPRGWLLPQAWYDHNGALDAFLGSAALPVTFILDPSGQIRFKLIGKADWASGDAAAFLRTVSTRAARKNSAQNR